MRVAHITSAHPRYDTRIFVKECQSLSAAGHEVYLIVADGQGDAVVGDISIVDVGCRPHRVQRMLFSARDACRRAAKLQADVYHLHDPELLPWSYLLTKQSNVIYDAHEDLGKQVLSKHYLPPFTRSAVAAAGAYIERAACQKVSHVVAATPMIAEKFQSSGIPSEAVCNFPKLDEITPSAAVGVKNGNQFCYVGSLSTHRGFQELLAAANLANSEATLVLAGSFAENDLYTRTASLPGWSKTKHLGVLDRKGISALLGSSVAGLVTLHPTPSYVDSFPVKMFEYMAAGIPVIASDFPRWRELISSHQCGICVDPHSPEMIADAMNSIIDDPERAAEMGRNGRAAVERFFNWSIEEAKLIRTYERLSSVNSHSLNNAIQN